MKPMTYFDLDATGNALPRQTRPRGQKMGVALLWLQARREALQARLYTICLWIACVTYGLALMAVLWMLAQAGRWAG